jgi:hypothetical protein
LINYKKLTYNFSQDEEDADDEDKDDKAGSDVEDHSDDEKHVCCSFHSFLVSELLHSFLLSDQALFSTLAFFISRMSSRWREFTLLPGFSSSPVMMFHLF